MGECVFEAHKFWVNIAGGALWRQWLVMGVVVGWKVKLLIQQKLGDVILFIVVASW